MLLDHALEFGSLPESTQKLLELTRRDAAEVGPVVDALALNPSLVAAVLRVANSRRKRVAQAAEHGDAAKLREEVVAAAHAVGLEQLDPDLLVSASITAAAEAELTLRSELGLSQTAPSNDVATSPASATAADKPRAVRRGGSGSWAEPLDLRVPTHRCGA